MAKVRIGLWGLGLAALLAAQPGAAQILQIGDRAPDFTLDELGGAALSLSDFKGKVVFIDFFGYN